VYFSAFFIVLLLAYLAQIKNKKKYMIFAALILALVAGLRADTVGIDTPNYIELFGYIAKGRFDLAYGLETPFKLICAILLFIWNNSNFLFLIFALITNVLIFARLFECREYISLPWAALIYLGGFYFITFNIVRQLVAAAIIFWATRYLAKKKYFKFLLFVAIACLFHRSALLGVLFVAFDIFAWKHLTGKQKNLLKLFWLLGISVVLLFGVFIIGRYFNYFKNVQLNLGLLLLVKMVLFVLTVPYLTGDKWRDTDYKGYSVAAYTRNTVKVYYAVGMLLTTLGYIFAYMDRIGVYFYLFETVYIGMVMRSKRIDILVRLVIAVLYLSLALITIFGNGQGQGNYLFCWQ
jgi:hypothetical protein